MPRRRVTVYAAVVDCRDGTRFVGGENPYYEDKFFPVTLSTFDYRDEAQREAEDACTRSPRDCRNPRVEIRTEADHA